MPFFFFIVYMLIEIALFAWVGGAIGVLNVLAGVVLSFFLGLYLVRTVADASRTMVAELQMGLQTPNSNPRFHRLLSGALLMVPGFFSDAIGLLLLVPPIRHVLFARFRSGTNTHSASYVETTYYEIKPETDVIEGEVIDDDEPPKP